MNLKKWLIFCCLAVIIISITLNNFWVDWRWFNSVGYADVWLKTLITKIALYGTLSVLLWAIIALNVLRARTNILQTINEDYSDQEGMSIKNYFLSKILTDSSSKFIIIVFSAVIGVTSTASGNLDWEVLQKFLQPSNFGIEDPIFYRDIGFYVFTLPFVIDLTTTLINSLFFATMITATLYALTMPSLLLKFREFSKAHAHLILLGATLLLLKSFSYYLERYLLLYSSKGVGVGASFTDIHALLPGLKMMIVIAIIISIAFVFSVVVKNLRIALGGLALFLIAAFGVGVVYPSLVQRFQVAPNEFTKEQPYIKHNISYTLKAYGLDKVKIEDFPATNNLTAEDIANNYRTINNIRLWDWRPIGQTFNQLQSLRPYYIFPEVDVDRYEVEGQTRQVIISARELDQSQLSSIQANNWVNQRLRYTHGYGAVVSPVNAISSEGLPTFFLKDIPFVTTTPFDLERPEIYFGEKTNDYILVKTNTKEFDYPLGDNNAESFYEGSGGIRISNLITRLNFALYFKDYRLLVSSELTDDTRVMFNRHISERAKKIAPFLQYDQDPYLVISDKKLYWIQDAYTTTSMYPYAEPYGNQFNYIRNPIKVVTDAYNGDIIFYLHDENEPLAATYSKIFPNLFKPINEIPDDLKSHLRYPESLFKIQSDMYTSYHMENPMVFYNKEDAWSIPEEIVSGDTATMEPYYVVMQLPNSENEEEFVLMLPFNAARINKMVAWMAARNDGQNYGELILYKFPKDKHIYGPLQVEGRIDQDSEISQQLSLWDQRGSQVLRGNLLVIPINNSILYIEPLYLQAEKSKIPELRRVIAVFGEKIVMEQSIEAALKKIFSDIPQLPDQHLETSGSNVPELISMANQFYSEALEKQKAGDWTGYGQALQNLQNTLLELDKLANSEE